MTAERTWRRLVAEGGVIVASILIAFAIDAAWDIRNERQAERALIAALEIDMLQNLDEINRVIAAQERTSDGAEIFLAAEPEELSRLEGDSLAAAWRLFQAASLDPVNSTLQSSDLSRLTDPALRRALGDWMRGVTNEQEGARLTLPATMELLRNASEKVPGIVPVPGEESGAALAALRRDPAFVAHVSTLHLMREGNIRILQALSARADSVLHLLRQVR